MKRILTLSVVMFLLVFTSQSFAGAATSAYSITQQSLLPSGLWYHGAVYVASSNKIYVFGGVVSNGTGTNDAVISDKIYVYDVTANRWSTASAKLPYAIFYANAALGGNGKIYLAPGLGPTENNGWGSHSKLIEYDPTTDTAKETTVDFGFTVWNSSLVAYQGDIYIFGGWTGSGVNKIWKYTTNTGTLTRLSTTLSKAANGISAMLGTDNKIYLFNGYPSGYVQIFNPADNSIKLSAAFDSTFANMPVWRDANNKFYIGTKNKIYEYTPSTETLQTSSLDLGSTAMNALDYAAAVTLSDNTVYIIGGTEDGYSASNNVWKLVPTSVLRHK
jgi:N-acetylneuraminic acid mutarotase